MATSNTESYDANQYVRLRTILDSLQDGSIRYYLEFQDSLDAHKRFEELESRLMPIIKWLWGGAGAIGCPPGYSNCNGVCVPYACPPDPPAAKAAKH
jgi:hypothetical protein